MHLSGGEDSRCRGLGCTSPSRAALAERAANTQMDPAMRAAPPDAWLLGLSRGRPTGVTTRVNRPQLCDPGVPVPGARSQKRLVCSRRELEATGTCADRRRSGARLVPCDAAQQPPGRPASFPDVRSRKSEEWAGAPALEVALTAVSGTLERSPSRLYVQEHLRG